MHFLLLFNLITHFELAKVGFFDGDCKLNLKMGKVFLEQRHFAKYTCSIEVFRKKFNYPKPHSFWLVSLFLKKTYESVKAPYDAHEHNGGNHWPFRENVGTIPHKEI